MKEKLVSLDGEVMMILTYIGKDGDRFNVDESSNIYINNNPLTPYNTGEPVKYFGIADFRETYHLLFERLRKAGFDMGERNGDSHPFARAFRENKRMFFAATHKVCTRPGVLRIPYDNIVDHLDGTKSIVAVNKMLGLGFYTVPIIDYQWTDKDLSDISVETLIPKEIKEARHREEE